MICLKCVLVYLDLLIMEVDANCVVIADMRVDNDMIVIDKEMIISEDKIQNVLLPCGFSDVLLKEKFLCKIKECLGLSPFRACVLTLLDIVAIFTCIL